MAVMIRASRPSDGPAVVEIWRRSVDATHDFLTHADRSAIDAEVAEFLPQTPLWLAVDKQDRPIGFMGVSERRVDSLFIDPDHHRKGVARALITHALGLHDVLETEVNEQNHGARAFYARLGFLPFARTPQDGEGRAYPLLHLRLDPRAASDMESALGDAKREMPGAS